MIVWGVIQTSRLQKHKEVFVNHCVHYSFCLLSFWHYVIHFFFFLLAWVCNHFGHELSTCGIHTLGVEIKGMHLVSKRRRFQRKLSTLLLLDVLRTASNENRTKNIVCLQSCKKAKEHSTDNRNMKNLPITTDRGYEVPNTNRQERYTYTLLPDKPCPPLTVPKKPSLRHPLSTTTLYSSARGFRPVTTRSVL